MEQIKYINDGIELDVNFSSEENTVWLTLNDMCLLYGKAKSTISRHLKNVLENGSQKNGPTVAKNATVQLEGDREVIRNLECYSLEIVKEIGQRTKSKIINIFYKWCIDNLNELRSKTMSQSNIIRFSEGKVSLDVNISPKEDTVWLTQNQIAILFDITQQNVSLHIKNIIEEEELELGATHKYSLLVQTENGRQVTRNVDYYNLDMILSIGYRVKSKMAIAFRRWASKVLKQYLMNGYVLDENRIMVSEANYRHLVVEVDNLSKRVDDVENKVHEEINDIKEKVFIEPIKERLFYDGEYYDAYEFVVSLVKKAKKELIVIDPYFDGSGLIALKMVNSNVDIIICASSKAKITSSELLLFEKQYGNKITLKNNDLIHDRFIIIDGDECYSIGTSINYMGKRTFTAHKIESDSIVRSIINLI